VEMNLLQIGTNEFSPNSFVSLQTRSEAQMGAPLVVMRNPL
jgi:hypothetical protein